MRISKLKHLPGQLLAIVVLLATTGFGPEPLVVSPISGEEFVRSMAGQRPSVIDLYFRHHLNPNARAAQDRPILLAAALQEDEETVGRLLNAGACVDLADETGLNPLMAAAMQGNIRMVRAFVGGVTSINATDRSGRTALDYAVTSQKMDVVELLLRVTPDLGGRGADLLATALETGNKAMVDLIVGRVPMLSQWTARTLASLHAAVAEKDADRVRLLMSKHSVPPTPEGRSVPLLAYAIASHDISLFTMLLSCGADPNTVLPERCDKDFLALLPPRLCNYIDGDKGITALMLASGLGQSDYVRALLDAGADKHRATARYKMIPLYLAAQTGKWQTAQVLLGSGQSPEELRIEITLASQRAELIKDGVSVFSTQCSTGRQGYTTRRGDYVITDKNRSHISTIYKVPMPFFMRLSCLDFGMHAGVVPNYPASHGCIRLPSEAARKLFAELPVGTFVSVR
jgi:ankyrin repeat protein